MLGRLCVAVTLLLAVDAPRPAQAGEPPTARIMVNPVLAKVGPPYPPLIGGGPNIVGNELRLDAGGVRVWVEVQFADWDPNGDGSPGAKDFIVTLDGSGLLDADINGDGSVDDDGDQEDIVHPFIPCASNSVCSTAFGEGWAKCSGLACEPVYTDKGGARLDGWCARPSPLGTACSCGDHPSVTESGWAAQGCYVADFRPDDGIVRWGATAVYDVPPGAKGKYTVELDTDRTFLISYSTTPPHIVPSLSETGFVIDILTGRCCYGFRTPGEGCVDSVTRAECGDDEPGPFVFTPEAFCAPDGPECAAEFGACCDTLFGDCVDVVLEQECVGEHHTWTPGTRCDEIACVADVGACCTHDPFGPCTDHALISDCRCPSCAWHKLQTCKDIECPADPIPTVSDWGLVGLTLLLMIAAKLVFRPRVQMIRR